MAKGFNKVILMGNLTRDPEVRTTSGGQSVANFSLAVNRSWKDQNGQTQEVVSYIDCVAWGKAGEIIAQYLNKGRPVLVSGRLDQRSWEDKETGGKRSKVEVVVEDFNFIDSGSGGNQKSGESETPRPSGGAKKPAAPVAEEIDDRPIDLSEIPF
ncbi:single-stranded DNA-binding protein [Candidatus Saccharibacteria bacterium]|nr:single-stranded DNA-binding protein [Candidatus Saccharibacteria bacterium]NCU40467.1 single-stranded DNA-binding protein [Candidatus Saccharibacteria bacterium]